MMPSILTKIIRRGRASAQRRASSALADLLSPLQIDRVIQRERARSDRTGELFSLVTFTVGHSAPDSETLAHLAIFLQRRLRLTDDVGLLTPRKIGVVLPATSASNAWNVVNETCLCIPAGLPLPACEVYCYPMEWPTEGILDDNDEDDSVSDGHATQPLERLFLRPIPFWKRFIDVAGSSFGLFMLAPLFALTALAIKATSRGPVFFRQKRVGLGGKPFILIKFRSMVVDAEARKRHLITLNEQDGPAFKIKNDPRITAVGRFIRASSIDELPQLWNVLRGDMSLVGPRPPLYDEVAKYETWHRRRLEVTPGLTCIWQVAGRSRVSFAEWIRMDVRYIRSRFPLWADLKLLILTLPALLFRRGC